MSNDRGVDADAVGGPGGLPVRAIRLYEVQPTDQGARWLVDRLWPRGVSRDSLRLAGWAREVAPSAELRRWFGHDPGRWVDFGHRYVAELDAKPDQWRPLLDAARAGSLLLLYGARDREHNNAIVLRDYLLERLPSAGRDEQGGESVCWLDRVCPECGRLSEHPLDGEACRTCSSLPADQDPPGPAQVLGDGAAQG